MSGLMLIGLGVAASLYAGTYVETSTKTDLLDRARTVAASLDVDDILGLSGTTEDLARADYQTLKDKMVRIRALNPDLHFVYLMGYRKGELFIYMDSEPVDSGDYSPPGDPYVEASALKVGKYLAGENFTEGPYADRWGTWVSGYASIPDPAGSLIPVGMVGVDISAARLQRQIAFAEAVPLIVAGLVIVILALVYAGRRRRERFVEVLRQEKEKLRVILEILPVGVVVYRATDGGMELANGSMRDIVGRAMDSRAKDAPEAFQIEREDGRPYSFDELPPGMTLKTGKPTRSTDVFVRHPDGTRVNTRVFAVPVKNTSGQMESVVVVAEDITKEREVDKMKSEFVSLASHQLQTPLTEIKWISELLMLGRAGKLSAEQKVHVRQILESDGRLIDLVQDLLNVSRMETGRKFVMEMKKTDLVPIVDSVVTELKAQAKIQRVTIVKDASFPRTCVLNLDEKKIRQVFANVIGNAVKYSEVGGRVEIGMVLAKQKGRVAFYVRDHGIGIPKAQQKRLFEKFFRADNARSLAVSGTGLGLYIAKAIAERHGGDIWFESEEGEGTTFFIGIPKKK